MGKVTIKVDPKTGQNYIPREVRKDGFVGEVTGLTNAVTLTFIKPGARLSDVEKSLHIMLADIALRIEQEENQKRDEKRESTRFKMLLGKRGAQHPLFTKYTRNWLNAMTGYSKGYLSRVATGKMPLSPSFIARVSFKLDQPAGELFLLDVVEE